MNTIGMSNIILSNLLDTGLEIAELKEIFTLIEGTKIEYQREVYECVLEFYENHKRYPEFVYLSAKYPNFVERTEVGYSKDIYLELIRSLRVEQLKASLQVALASDNYTGLMEILEVSKKGGKEYREVTLDESMLSYDRMLQQPAGVLTGVKEIDELLKGLSYGTTTVIAAPPGNFKTTYGISILYNAVFRNGFNFVDLVLEGAPDHVWFSLMARHSYEMGTPLSAEKMKKGLLTDKEYLVMKEVKKDWEKNCKGKLYLLVPAELEDFNVASIVGFLNQRDKESPLDGVLVDYIQLLKFYKPKSLKREEETLNYYVRFFSNLGVVFKGRGLVIILLSQINREGWKTLVKKKKATLFSFSESNELERSSSNAIVLYADEAMRLSNQVDIGVVKNRTGRVSEQMSTQYVNAEFFVVGDKDFADIFSAEASNLIADLGKEEGFFS